VTTIQDYAIQSPSSSAKPFRVLMVCARYLPETGGTETHVNEVARRLSELDHLDITVLATDRTKRLPRQEVLGNVKVLRVAAWPPNRDYYFAPQIASEVAQPGRWDLVHCQGIHTPVPIIAMMAARRADIPYMVTFHTGGHTLRHRNAMRSIQWRLAGPLLRNAVSLVGVSRFEAEAMSRHAGLGDKPVDVIYNGGTLPAPPSQTAQVPGRIVSIGRLERYKGHQRAIDALPHLLRDVPDCHLVVLGSGPYESKLREHARHLGVAERVTIRYVPPSDRQAMATAVAQASVVVALSDYEAHPVAVMEALSLSRPVVGYDTAGVADLVAKGWVRGIAPGASPVAVAGELLQAMSPPHSAEQFDLPTWDSCAAELAQLYLAFAARCVSRGSRSRASREPVAR
jgi:glycosyltransferase involved in cell wall biosynthesis